MSPTTSSRTTRSIRALITLAGFALCVVIVAPVALSSQDLYQWSGSGLGLHENPWPWLVFGALDACAVVCITMVVIASWISVPAPLFSVLVWVFAGASGFANYRQGAASDAPDAVWFFPLMSVLGPLLLEACLAFLRKAVRRQAQDAAAERFTGTRWVLAPISTWRAWRLTVLDRRVGVSEALDRMDPRRTPPAPVIDAEPPAEPPADEPPAEEPPAPARRKRVASVPIHNLKDLAQQIPPEHRTSRDKLAAALRERGVPISTDRAGSLYESLNGATA